MPSDDIDDLDLPDPQATPERSTEESRLRRAMASLGTHREPLVLQVLVDFHARKLPSNWALEKLP